MHKGNDPLTRLKQDREQIETQQTPPVADVPGTIMKTGATTAGAGIGAALITAATAPVIGPFSPLLAPVGAVAGAGVGFGVGYSASSLRDWLRKRAFERLELKNLEARKANMMLDDFTEQIRSYIEAIEASANFIFAQTSGIEDNTSLSPDYIIDQNTFMNQTGWSDAERKLHYLIFKTQYASLKGDRINLMALSDELEKLLGNVIDEKALNYLEAYSLYPSSKRTHNLQELIILDPIDQIQYLSLYKTPAYIKDVTVRYVHEKPEPDKEMLAIKTKINEQTKELLENQIRLQEKAIENLRETMSGLIERIAELQMDSLDTHDSLKKLCSHVSTIAKTQEEHIADAEEHMEESKAIIKNKKESVAIKKDLAYLKRELRSVQEKIEKQSSKLGDKQVELNKIKKSLGPAHMFSP